MKDRIAFVDLSNNKNNMKSIKSTVGFICAVLMLAACGQQNKNETTMDFTDDVQVALADSGRIDLNSLQWTREPKGYEVKGDTILITCR